MSDDGRPSKRQKKAAAKELKELIPATEVDVEVRLYEMSKSFLTMEDLQGLLMWIAGDGVAPKWALVKGRPLVPKICVVLLPGLSPALHSAAGAAAALPRLAALCPLHYPTKVDARVLRDTSFLQDLFFRRPRQSPAAAPGHANGRGHSRGGMTTAQACAIAAAAARTAAAEAPQPPVEGSDATPAPATPPTTAPSPSPPAPSPPTAAHPKPSNTAEPEASPTVAAENAAVETALGSGAAAAAGDPSAAPLVDTFALPEEYLLSMEQLVENKYPVQRYASEMLPAEYARSRPRAHGPAPESRRIVAIDCEMCVTAVGQELTRVTAVDMDFKVVYDTFVLPPNPIVDYVTKYSGISEETLAGVTTTLADVHRVLLGDDNEDGLVTEDTILLGHSLDNDLHALKLVHHRVIDTAVLFPHPQGPPYKSALRWLVNHYLRKQIQGFVSHSTAHNPVRDADGNVPAGHDSRIDASVCLELLALKLRHGPTFGMEQSKSQNVLQVVAELRTFGVTCIDRAAHVRRYSSACTSAVVATSDDDAVAKGVAALKREAKALVVVGLRSLWDLYATQPPTPRAPPPSQPPAPASPEPFAFDASVEPAPPSSSPSPTAPTAAPPTPPPAAPSPSPEEVAVLEAWDHGLQSLHAAAPPNTVFLVLTGQGYGAEVGDKGDQRAHRDGVRRGLAWILVKR